MALPMGYFEQHLPHQAIGPPPIQSLSTPHQLGEPSHVCIVFGQSFHEEYCTWGACSCRRTQPGSNYGRRPGYSAARVAAGMHLAPLLGIPERCSCVSIERVAGATPNIQNRCFLLDIFHYQIRVDVSCSFRITEFLNKNNEYEIPQPFGAGLLLF